MVVALGLDGSLLDYFRFVSEYYFEYCKSKGVKVNYNPTEDEVNKMLGLDSYQYADFMSSYGCKYYYIKFLFPSVKEVLDNIKNSTFCTYCIVDGRSCNDDLNALLSSRFVTSEQTLTKQMIQSNKLPISDKNVWSGDIKLRVNKIISTQAKYVVESNKKVINELIKKENNCKKIFVIDNPWNREITENTKVTRIYSFKELEYRLLKEEEDEKK